MDELEQVEIVFHNYLIANLTYSTAMWDFEMIKKTVKVPKLYIEVQPTKCGYYTLRDNQKRTFMKYSL